MSRAVSAIGTGAEFPRRNPDRAFFGITGLLFLGSAVWAISWCVSMSKMGGMQMPGGWAMSMAWTQMPSQSWTAVAASFLGMWLLMMVAMMLPSLVPMLRRYRLAIGTLDGTRLGLLTGLVGAGYFAVWTVVGAAVFPLGAALAALEMRLPALARAVPIAVGSAVIVAGAIQFTSWKARQLACSREEPRHGRAMSAGAATAWRHGLMLGLHCYYCCANLMAILLMTGVMDLRAMAAVTAAITFERLAPSGERAARSIGAIAIGAGLIMIARATL